MVVECRLNSYPSHFYLCEGSLLDAEDYLTTQTRQKIFKLILFSSPFPLPCLFANDMYYLVKCASGNYRSLTSDGRERERDREDAENLYLNVTKRRAKRKLVIFSICKYQLLLPLPSPRWVESPCLSSFFSYTDAYNFYSSRSIDTEMPGRAIHISLTLHISP